MKVSDRKGAVNPELGGVSGPPEPVVGRPSEDSAVPSGDSVRVSQVARALARLVDHGGVLAEGLAVIRSEKVEPLREAVQGGRYTVDVEATARKFLSELLGGAR